MAESRHSAYGAAAELERAGIRTEQTHWGATVYTGTRDAMVSAGLVTPAQVPGDPTCPRTAVFRFEREGRWHAVSLSRGKRLVKLRANPTREEYEAQWAQRAAESEARSIAADVEKNIAALPPSREAYGLVVRWLTSVRSARESLRKPFGGYRLPEHAIDEFEEAVAEAVDELLEHITFSRAARDREIAAWRQEAAAADPDFARFMQAASARRE
jgi:hypothetical protein